MPLVPNEPEETQYSDPVLDGALDAMGLSAKAILEKQERVIVRLRAALLTLGKTPKDIDIIATDQDS